MCTTGMQVPTEAKGHWIPGTGPIGVSCPMWVLGTELGPVTYKIRTTGLSLQAYAK